MDVKQKVQEIKDYLQNFGDIKLIVATKYMGLEQTKELIEAGITDFGENRSDMFLEKFDHFKEYNINWHFFGVVQSRKVRDVVNRISCLHSLDKVSLAMELDKRLEKTLDCFIQINISDEPNKQGIPLAKTKSFVKSLVKCEHIRIIGLMCIAKLTCETEVIERSFEKMHKMQKEIEAMQLPYAPCHYLSMGMSNDYKIALENGATHIRLGRIFLE